MTDHPDKDRWWNRKFYMACGCTAFAGAVLISGLIWRPESPLVMPGVWAFMVPLLAFLGLAEVNNIWGKR